MTKLDTDWQVDALCAEVDNEFFFPDAGKAYLAEAMATCNLCTVKEECGLWATKEGFQYGIFGGMGPRARAQLRAEKERTEGWTPLVHNNGSPPGGSAVDRYLVTRQPGTIARSSIIPTHMRGREAVVV